MSYDTTDSNTGRKTGANVLTQQQIEPDLLYLACRHYIHKLVAGAPFHCTLRARILFAAS